MTTPFPFVASQVLTAQQLNDITNLPINDQTASYVLVVGDAGKRVVMNVASSNTVTVNNSVFTTGDTIQIVNKGAGVSTVTAGAGVTINTSDSLALAQYQSGSLVALSASSFLFFPSAETAPASGLTRISGGTLSGASTTFDSVFSSTYLCYLITVSGGVNTGGNFTFQLRYAGPTTQTSGYYGGIIGSTNASAASAIGTNNAASFVLCSATAVDFSGYILVHQRAAATRARWASAFHSDALNTTHTGGGENTTARDYTGFILNCTTSFSAGTVNIYGFAAS